MSSRDTDMVAGGTNSDDTIVDEQLKKALDDMTRQKDLKDDEKGNGDQWKKSNSWGVEIDSPTSSLRDKYLDKINRLKEKKRENQDKKEESRVNVTGPGDDGGNFTSAGLSTWIVNPGTNEVLVRCDDGMRFWCNWSD